MTNEVMTVAIAKKAEVVFIENLQLFCKRALRSRITRREAGQVELFFAETPNGLGAEGNCLTLNAKVKSQL